VVNQRSGGSSLNSQFVLVQSGREGFIEIARDVPMIDYFTRYVAGRNLRRGLGDVRPWSGATRTRSSCRPGTSRCRRSAWGKGRRSHEVVQPVAEGDSVAPRRHAADFRRSPCVDPGSAPPTAPDAYLACWEQYVTLHEMTGDDRDGCGDGREVTIGGLDKAEPQFSRYFFGATESNSDSHGTFTVRATIQ